MGPTPSPHDPYHILEEMSFLLLLLLVALMAVTVRADCDAYGSDQTKCLKSTGSDGVSCAYCTSGAVGGECLSETDAKSLPTSVFRCTYQTAKRLGAAGCEAHNTDKTTCLKTKEGTEKCAYCVSGAVGSECVKESDAKGLPSSVFTCSY